MIRKLLAAAAFAVASHSVAFAQPAISQPSSLPLQIPNARAESTLTLSSGAATLSRASHLIAAESGVTDTVTSFVVSAFQAGDTIKIAADAGDTITIDAAISDTGESFDLTGDSFAYVHVQAAGAYVVSAGQILSDSGANYFASNVEGALAEIAKRGGKVIDVREYGFIADGTSHTVAEWITGCSPCAALPLGRITPFADIAAVRSAFSGANARSTIQTTDEIDWVAAQEALDRIGDTYGRTVKFPSGVAKIQETLTVGNGSVSARSTINDFVLIVGDGGKVNQTRALAGQTGPEAEAGLIFQATAAADPVFKFAGPMTGVRVVGQVAADNAWTAPGGVLVQSVNGCEMESLFAARVPDGGYGVRTTAINASSLDGSSHGINTSECRFNEIIAFVHTSARATGIHLTGAVGTSPGNNTTVSRFGLLRAGFAHKQGVGIALGFTDNIKIDLVSNVSYGEWLGLALFDGASSSVVSTSTDTLNISAHGFATGDRVLYTQGTGGTAIGGLTDTTIYYVVNKQTHSFQLSATPGGAAIDITAVGVGSYHRLRRVFDPATAVNLSTDTITEASHGFQNGDRVLYNVNGGTAMTPLGDAYKLFVVGATADTYQLAYTRGGSAIDITTAGTGAQHSVVGTSAGIELVGSSSPFNAPQNVVIGHVAVGQDAGVELDNSGGNPGPNWISSYQLDDASLIPDPNTNAYLGSRLASARFPINSGKTLGLWGRTKTDATNTFNNGFWGVAGGIAGSSETTDATNIYALTRGTNNDLHVSSSGGISFQPAAASPSDARDVRITTAGDLQIFGNKLHLDLDLDTYLEAATDDQADLYIANTLAFKKTAQNLFLYYDDAGGSAGPLLQFQKDTASPATNDVVGDIVFNSKDSAAASTTYAGADAIIVSPTDGAEAGRIRFKSISSGAFATRAYIQAGLVVGSPTGGDKGAGASNTEKTCVNGNCWYSASTAPATCAVGELFTDTDGGASTTLYVCTATNTWTAK